MSGNNKEQIYLYFRCLTCQLVGSFPSPIGPWILKEFGNSNDLPKCVFELPMRVSIALDD